MAEGRLPPVTRGSSTCAWGRLPSPAAARVMPCHACLAFRPWLSVPCQIASVRRIRETSNSAGERILEHACCCCGASWRSRRVPGWCVPRVQIRTRASWTAAPQRPFDGPTGAAPRMRVLCSDPVIRSAESPVGSYGSSRWHDPNILLVYRPGTGPCTRRHRRSTLALRGHAANQAISLRQELPEDALRPPVRGCSGRLARAAVVEELALLVADQAAGARKRLVVPAGSYAVAVLCAGELPPDSSCPVGLRVNVERLCAEVERWLTHAALP